jgi:hypothetical protein
MVSWNYSTTILYIFLAVLNMPQTDTVSPQKPKSIPYTALYNVLAINWFHKIIEFVLAKKWFYNVALSPSSLTI